MSRLARLRALIWPEPQDRLERTLLRKADWLILSYLCLTFCVNYLDRVNYYNAYISGMREDLAMTGRDYNKVIAFFTAGFAVAQIPQNMLLLVVPPRILFPLNGVIWGGLTMVSAAATKVQHLYVIKFFQGMAEASTFVGAHYILGSWYKPQEIGKRTAIFACSSHAATLFSGSLQAIPIALYGAFVFPDTPANTRSRFFTPEERALAMARLGPREKTRFDWTLVRRVLSRWEAWLLSLIWIANGALESFGSWGIMGLWMKAQMTAAGRPLYTITQLNHYPLATSGVAILSLLIVSCWTDNRTQDRWVANIVIALSALVSATLVLVNGLHPGRLPRGALFFAFYFSGITFAGQSTNFSWANELFADDEQARGIALAMMNVLCYAFNAWFQVEYWKASSTPAFTQGSSLMLAFVPLMLVFTGAARFLQVRDQRRSAACLSSSSMKHADGEADVAIAASLSSASGLGGAGRSKASLRPSTGTTEDSVALEEEQDKPEGEPLRGSLNQLPIL
ncbi:hypothetical protein Rhopal_006740-T1 [Rhodotorula paludigena]|uniref:MFS general substrate transporter n=1 Tax=Rhodotorula paludigena TaxID=86838 RepID=A0AAV5GYV3_9BASI|nr:hypothetical protein Rhopal_006740-T1 [Rhodotorula paludigena]